MQSQSPSQEGTLLFCSQYVSNSACPKSPISQDLWECQLFFLGFLPYGKTSLCNLLPVSFTVLVERHTQEYAPFAVGCFQLQIIFPLIYLKAASSASPHPSSTDSFITILFSPFSAHPLLSLSWPSCSTSSFTFSLHLVSCLERLSSIPTYSLLSFSLSSVGFFPTYLFPGTLVNLSPAPCISVFF